MDGYLILSRGHDEAVTIFEPGTLIVLPTGESIKLTQPIEIKWMQAGWVNGTKKKTRIGIRAPKPVPILRKELYEEGLNNVERD